MKKEYKKPLIYIESLVVSEFIAGTCAIDVGFSETSCKLVDQPDPDFDPITYFALGHCEKDPRPNKENGFTGICYHGTTDPKAYFGS